MSRVVVVGSVNADLVLDVARIPGPGETVLAGSSRRAAGGKGGNQAVAAARASAATSFLGAVGDDADGRMLRAALQDAGVDVAALRTVEGPSGLAVVVVSADGENSIVVAPGANASVTELTAADTELVAAANVLLMQLEIPLAGVLAAAGAGAGLVMLNAAPAQELPDELWSRLDVLIVNEHEVVDLGGGSVDEAVDALLDRVPQVVVTLGAAGARWAHRDGRRVAVVAPTVTAVDTTGAGDTFCGVLAAALADGTAMDKALARAVVAGSLSVQKPGAVPSIPTAAEIDAALP